MKCDLSAIDTTPLLKPLLSFPISLSLCEAQAASAVSLAFRVSTLSFNTSATPGMASTLSHSTAGISGLITAAISFRCSADNCPTALSVLSICAVASLSLGSARLRRRNVGHVSERRTHACDVVSDLFADIDSRGRRVLCLIHAVLDDLFCRPDGEVD